MFRILLLTALVGASNFTSNFTYAASEFGQETLRQAWQETSPSATASLNEFKRSHFLADVAEDRWKLILEGQYALEESLGEAKDVKVSQFHARRNFSLDPFDIKKWGSSLISHASNVIKRPFDSISLLKSIYIFFVPAFALSLFLLLVLHFSIWARAICKDFPKWFGSNSPIVLIGILFGIVVWTVRTGLWAPTLFLMIAAMIVYSRRPQTAIVLGFLFALSFTFGPFLKQGLSALENLSAVESLSRGRTRI